MPIDDVQYLLRNSVKDSVMLFIDSSNRNRQKYPTPSKYTVELDEPISHVYGIDILDAAIPSTMYNVDTNNNVMRFVAVTISQSEGLESGLGSGLGDEEVDDAHTAALNTAMTAMGLASPLRTVWLPDPNRATYKVVVGVWDDGSAPSSLATLVPDTIVTDSAAAADDVRYRALRERRFGPVHMWRVGAGASVGTVVPSNVTTMELVSNGQTYYLDIDGSAAASDAVAEIRAMANRDATLRQYAVLPSATAVSPDQYDLYVYATYTLPDEATFAAVGAEMASAAVRRLRFDVVSVVFEVGNYFTLNDLQNAITKGFAAAKISAMVTSTQGIGVTDNRGTFRFVAASDLRLIFAVAHSSARTALGFDLDADMAVNKIAFARRGHNAVALGGEVAPMYCTVLQADGSQRLDTPGIVLLAGPRYIALRCPQIEQHMSSMSRYGRTGIGVFKLLNTNEIAQLRFDYVSLVRKPFHPIARLSRLQLSFELPDGTLYDFKGVNHQIMLTINYYVPSSQPQASQQSQQKLSQPQTAPTPTSTPTPTPTSQQAGVAPQDAGRKASERSLSDPIYVLNPNYNPNFIDYMANRGDPFGQAGSKLGGYDPYNEDNDVDDYDDDDDDDDEDDDYDEEDEDDMM
jgi:hypothetical protein